MAHHNVRIPDSIERGAKGGPRFKTTILTLSSGHEKRNIDWQRVKCAWDIGYGMQYKEDYDDIIAFFYARQGKAHSFNFKDWTDFQIGTVGVASSRQSIGTGTGSNSLFQIFKRYSSGGIDFDRRITRITPGSLTVYVNGVVTTAFTINLGLINFTTPPPLTHPVEVICEFEVPVRFDQDELDIEAETFQAGSIPSINVVEVRE